MITFAANFIFSKKYLTLNIPKSEYFSFLEIIKILNLSIGFAKNKL